MNSTITTSFLLLAPAAGMLISYSTARKELRKQFKRFPLRRG